MAPLSPRLTHVLLGAVLSLTTACEPDVVQPDDPTPYLEDVDFRRAVLERDLVNPDNNYSARRLAHYGIEGERWEVLPERDPPSRPLFDEDRERLAEGEPLEFDPAEADTLMPDELPRIVTEWERLGQRVMAEYPLRIAPEYEALAAVEGGLEQSGFVRRPDGGWVGLRVFQDADGDAQVGISCAQCHCTYNDYGELTPQLANKSMDVGLATLLGMGLDPDAEPEDIEEQFAALYTTGPGRADVMADGLDNPLAIPDLGGIADQPYLQQNVNWVHTEPATLAIRCETLFITANAERSRLPRELAWAVGAWIRSQDAPPPLDDEPASGADAGAVLFEDEGCPVCHEAPTYTSDRKVPIEDIGTDDAALLSPDRFTGFVRIPSLRGVGRTAPYLHHGAVQSLEEMFDPDREAAGHPFGMELSVSERERLVAFLRSL